MRIKDIIAESEFKDMPLQLGKYRGPYDPRTMEPYSGEHADSSDLTDVVDELIDSGYTPQVASMNPSDLTATQDWLSDQGSDEVMFPKYQDKPVVLRDGQIFYILDGHHRIANASKMHKQIQVYLFNELE